MKKFDLVIIGRGAAAFSAAIKASELSRGKASVAMVGVGALGGTCVNVGCVPSKYLLEASFRYYNQSAFPGVDVKSAQLDFSKLMEGLRSFVAKAREEKYVKVIQNYPNVELIEGKARFSSNGSVLVDGKNEIQGKNVIIAVGSRPSAPPIEGLEDTGYITSDSVWQATKKPSSLAVIGGGAIGLEIGQAFQHFGTQVTVIEAMPRILANTEREISDTLQQKLEEEGMKFFLKARISSVNKKGEKKLIEVVTAQGKSLVETEEILVATGRAPNTHDLALEAVGVETDKRGFIKTDLTMKTSNPKIYAAGDCVSKRLMLETLAAREGVIAVSNIFGEEQTIDYDSVPWAVFTNPQVTSVGMTEEELMQKTGACSCRLVTLENVIKAKIIGEEAGVVKLVIDPSTQKVAGVHALSPYAAEFIIEGALAIKHGYTLWDVIDTVHIFPTLSESVKLAAQAFLRSVERMSCCVE
jgi:mercuric reductase